MVTEVFTVEAGYGYEWSEFHVYRHPADRSKFVIDEQNGCSCNYYVPPTHSELQGSTPLSKHEVYVRFSAWWDDDCHNSGTKIDNMQHLRDALK